MTVALASIALLAACGGGKSSSSATSSSSTTGSQASNSQAPTTTNAAAGSASGTPSRKPCDLLTKKIAEDALGVAVGDAKEVAGQGNETCAYSGADASVLAKVLLTTYAAAGSKAVLDQAATQFTNSYAASGVGDAARISIEDHAIGVLKGDFVFGMTLIPPGTGQNLAPVTEAQLVKVASAVVAEL
jgi:hypothetical protein